eukprot:1143203-Pelagomonas_calceolata.AAC.1
MSVPRTRRAALHECRCVCAGLDGQHDMSADTKVQASEALVQAIVALWASEALIHAIMLVIEALMQAMVQAMVQIVEALMHAIMLVIEALMHAMMLVLEALMQAIMLVLEALMQAMVQAIETGYLHPTLNQDNLVDEVSDMDTCAGGKVKHEVGQKSNCFNTTRHREGRLWLYPRA